MEAKVQSSHPPSFLKDGPNLHNPVRATLRNKFAIEANKPRAGAGGETARHASGERVPEADPTGQ